MIEAKHLSDAAIQKEYRRLMDRWKRQKEVTVRATDAEKMDRFKQLSEKCTEMAVELLAKIDISIKQERLGIVELSSECIILDESCSVMTRQTFQEPFQIAEQIWIETENGHLTLRFAFLLDKEKQSE